MNQYKTEHKQNVEEMPNNYKKEIVQRITKNLLDIQILRLLQAQPLWGYKIKKHIETKFGVKIRHGALYPLLNMLEKEGFLTSKKQQKGGRTRKVYATTQKAKDYIEAYNEILKEQISHKDIK